MDLPVDVCEKIIESMISLIQRSNKWVEQQRFSSEQQQKNPYVTILITNRVHESLPCLHQIHHNEYLRDSCLKLDKLLVASNANVNYTANISYSDVATSFGLPTVHEIKLKSTKRRVIRGLEDGDLRIIESAVGKLCI